MLKETVALLGHRGTDKVTGYEGVITSVCFDLYGCIQVALTPPSVPSKEKVDHGGWFDVGRVEVSAETVMPVPDFEARGLPATYDFGASPKPEPRQ